MTDIRRAEPSAVRQEHRFLLDTNVWMDLYYLNPSPRRYARASATLFKAIKASGATVVFNLVTLSEFVNAFARAEFNVFKRGQQLDFKRDFRSTAHFDKVRDTLRKVLSKILRDVQVKDVPPLDIRAPFGDFCSGDVDINDAILARCAAREGCILLSHDGDMAKIQLPIEIWTANERVLTGAP